METVTTESILATFNNVFVPYAVSGEFVRWFEGRPKTFVARFNFALVAVDKSQPKTFTIFYHDGYAVTYRMIRGENFRSKWDALAHLMCKTQEQSEGAEGARSDLEGLGYLVRA